MGIRKNINKRDENGLKQGYWQHYFAYDGVHRSGCYKDDKETGLWLWYKNSGMLLLTEEMLNGKSDGTTKWYKHANGMVSDIITSDKNNSDNWVSKQFNMLGQITRKKSYENNKIIEDVKYKPEDYLDHLPENYQIKIPPIMITN